MSFIDMIAKKIKGPKSTQELMAQLNRYVDDIPEMTDVSEFRMATAQAIAAHNEMKIEALENKNEEMFEFLSPFSKYFLKMTKLSEAAQAQCFSLG